MQTVISVSLLNEFRGVCIYQRGSARSLIEYDAYTFKDVFSPTIVSMKTDARRTHDLHLLFNHRQKNRRVKSVGTSHEESHARELMLSDVHQNLVFRVLCMECRKRREEEKGRAGKKKKGRRERGRCTRMLYSDKNLPHNEPIPSACQESRPSGFYRPCNDKTMDILAPFRVRRESVGLALQS